MKRDPRLQDYFRSHPWSAALVMLVLVTFMIGWSAVGINQVLSARPDAGGELVLSALGGAIYVVVVGLLQLSKFKYRTAVAYVMVFGQIAVLKGSGAYPVSGQIDVNGAAWACPFVIVTGAVFGGYAIYRTVIRSETDTSPQSGDNPRESR